MPLDIRDVYRDHSKFVYNVAYRMLRNKNDAEDVTHDVFIKLMDTAGAFKGNSSVKTYIYRITVNLSIDLVRKHQSLARRAERSWEPVPAAAQDDSLLLDSLLGALNEKHRAIVLLYEIAGCSQKEISEALGIGTGTIKSIISRSIARMAGLLREEGQNALQRRQTVFLHEKRRV
jgi:RNA polymerase sigma factor (sigma-70 family)